METTLFYFSATGNSMTTAHILAEKLPDKTKVISLASLVNETIIEVKSEAVGFVFPIYYGDMPYLVRACIEKMHFEGTPYIFLMATYRGHPGEVAGRLEELLEKRGVRLALSVGIPMPGNSYLSTEEQIRDTLSHQTEHIEALIPDILARKTENDHQEPFPKPSKVSVLHNFRAIQANASCIGCGVCARVCPLGNVTIQDGKAIVHDGCMTCLSCFHWCPQHALVMEKEPDIAHRPQYHHPQVTLKMILDSHQPSASH